MKSDILATRQSLSKAKSALAVAKSTYPLDIRNIAALSDEIKSYEDGILFIEATMTELKLTDQDIAQFADSSTIPTSTE